MECGKTFPYAEHVKCVKPQGHDKEHAGVLDYHPAGRHGPEQYEWAHWTDDMTREEPNGLSEF